MLHFSELHIHDGLSPSKRELAQNSIFQAYMITDFFIMDPFWGLMFYKTHVGKFHCRRNKVK